MVHKAVSVTYQQLGKTLLEILRQTSSIEEPKLNEACRVALLLHQDIGKDLESLDHKKHELENRVQALWEPFLLKTYTLVRDLGGNAHMVCAGAQSDGANEAEIVSLLGTLFDLSNKEAMKVLEETNGN